MGWKQSFTKSRFRVNYHHNFIFTNEVNGFNSFPTQVPGIGFTGVKDEINVLQNYYIVAFFLIETYKLKISKVVKRQKLRV